ncbi:hypothetical protein SAMN02745248_01491 [Hathewaya proteolytica DSM 3090]|uniref:Uncharacterized protein n=1 Tax=Hathewaya proteolytica DSM 3090 TaxID=1121331 RepID=A0A1M6NU69_9CLOT|nr:hypothetical protein [Hathewaya proteolytica]SHJ99174.1 hypothetical protein SAMN02745248_01491 [Hathewaya proteolytica DSM 3090]
MKFIGPFLKINTLSKESILHQLFYLSKESVHNLVFESKCGISIPPHELGKSIDKNDFNFIRSSSPLICMYRKCSAKLSFENDKLMWNSEKAKKDILISSNGFMTLALMELCDYYKLMSTADKDKGVFRNIYHQLSKLQLDFYAMHLRNTQGFFTDKKHISDMFVSKADFEEKKSPYKLSEQALMMCAYYKLGSMESYLNSRSKKESKNDDNTQDDNLNNGNKITKNQYVDFALDILNMLVDYRESIYNLTYGEKIKICFYLCIFYQYSNNEDCKSLIFDLYDLICEEYSNISIITKYEYILNKSLLSIVSLFMVHYFNFEKAKKFSNSLINELVSLYDDKMCIFNKTSSGKTIEYASDEIMTYIYALYLHSYINGDDDVEQIIENIFKKSIVNSGLIPSWPQVPNLNSPERYKNFSKKSEDLLDDEHFRLSTIPTPEEREVAPVFLKHLYINTKKFEFKVSKCNFDSSRNMYIFFLNVFLQNYFSNNNQDS